MSVPTNLIPTLITGLQEYTGSSTLGYMPYILDGRTYKVQFANIAAVGAVPSSRVIAAGTGLAGGGDLSANRVISIANGGVGFDQLALSGVTQGTYGSGSAVPILTVDSKGRITSATTAPLDVTGFVPTSRTITAGDGLTGGGSLANNISLAANFSATTPSALGTASAGTAITVSRGDHVHPAVNLSDTTQTQGALPLGRGGTGDALSPVAGAVVYSTGSKFALTNPGLPGQVLSSNGTDEPQWTSVGAGTVISVGVATANGFAGTVTNPSLNPVITLSTTVTGMLKGDGTAVSAATAGVDYVEPGAYVTSGLTMASARLLGRTTASVGAAEELTVGTGLTLSGGSLVNAAPDQVVALTGGTAISVTGTYPSFTITNTAPDQTVSLTAGTAISISGTYPSFSVTNTAPDQVVSLTGAGTTTVTGTYPSFTITSNDSTSGTVTSVNASGGTTGMSFTGGPITSAGTLTLNGTLAVANGGTGATDAATALTNLGAYPASNPAGYTTNVGTVTSVSGTGTVSGLSLSGTVTSAGSLTLGGTLAVLPSNFASQTANTVLAAPNGSAGVPTFRSLVAADVPTLNQNTTGTAANVTGIVAVANGGTGASVAGTARSNLGAAASGANTDITSIALTTGTISATPTNGADIVNKTYADSIASGINFHQSVRLATAAALPANTYNNGASGVGATLTANANGALSVDGVAVAVGNRILVKDEATQANNGVYTATQVGNGSTPYILTRATDFDSSGAGVDQIDAGDFFLVTAGSTLANTSWVQQTPLPITVGTTALVFTQFAAPVLYTAGTGLTLAGTTFSITNTGVTASTYGSASSVPVLAINAQGQVTSASSSSIAIAASQITSGALAIANGGTGATSAATALTNLGAYPASNPSGFTSNTGTVTSVNLTAGTGISVSGGPVTASGSITVVNTAPDQVVSLTGSGATTVTGTYPNFTISSPASGAGTVTSINVSGGTTGLTTSGGPVTSSGTITLAGTLNVANGGTGATTLSSGYLLKGNGTSAVSASVIYDNGTNAGIGTATPQALLALGSGSAAASNPTYGGSLLIASQMSSLAQTGGIEFRSVNFASGYGHRVSSPDLGSGNTPLVFERRTNSVSWTESMRIDSSGTVLINRTSSSGIGKLNVDGGADVTSGNVTVQAGYGIAWRGDQSRIMTPDDNSYGALIRWGATGGCRLFESTTERLRIDGTGSVTAFVDVRAPIFYDSNNTAFYANMDGTSEFNTIQTRGGSGFRSFATPAASINSQLYFADASNTRAWNWQLDENNNAALWNYNGSAWAKRMGVTSPDSELYLRNSSGSDVSLAYPSTFGYSSSYKTMVLGNQAYTTICIGVSPASNPSGSFNGTGSGVEVMFKNGVNFITPNSANNSYLTPLTLADGYAASTGSFRAPIFYDSNNTAYYGDFAGTSSLNSLIVGTNGSTLAYNAAATGNLYFGSAGGDANLYYHITTNMENVGGNYSKLDFKWYTGQRFYTHYAYGGVRFKEITTGNTLFSVGESDLNVRVANAIYSPIYYDGNNSAYYGDFASTSVLFGLTITGTGNKYLQIQSTDSGEAMVRYLGATGPSWYVGKRTSTSLVDTASFHFYSESAGATVAGIDVSGNMLASGSMRAPIFYDNNNTGYYVDPASTSRMNNLSLDTVAITSGITGLTSAPIATQYYNIGTTPTWMPMTYQRAVYDSGYITHLNTGLYKNANAWGVGATGWYAAIGGSDTSPTQAWYLTYDAYIQNSLGYVSTSGSFRAPIFYDENNTTYYLDPATGFNFLSSGVTFSSSGSGLFVTNAEGMGAVTRLGAAWNRPGSYSNTSYTLGSESSLHFWISGLEKGYIDSASNLVMNGSIQAPIFYDLNNTAYFVNPNSNSALAGALVIGPTGGGAYTRFGASAGDTTYSTISASNGNLHIDSQAGYDLYLNWYTARPVWSEGGAYFPIYYDRNDTAFYMNPNAGSRFQTIDVNDTIYSNNWFRSYGSSGWYNQSYAGGIFMQDTTWVRVYNGKAFYVPNEIAATGNITAYYSDERLKTKTGGIDNALEKLSGLSGFLYVENDLARSLGYSNDKQQVGVSAQAVQAVLPEAVSLAPVDFETLEDGTIVSKSGENYLTVDYSRLVPLLIEAIKELENKVKALEAKEQ